MCGRFTQHYAWAEVQEFMSVFGTPRNLQPHYNIAPTMTVDVICLGKDGTRELVPMRWGLIPERWKKSAKETPATFNARAESVADERIKLGRRKRRPGAAHVGILGLQLTANSCGRDGPRLRSDRDRARDEDGSQV